jgi:hypothetical protein
MQADATTVQQQIAGLKSVVASQQAHIVQLQQQSSQANYVSFAMGIQRGAVLGIVGTLLLLGAAHVVEKLMSSLTVKKKPLTQAAAVGR